MSKIDTPVTILVALKGKLRNAHIRTLKTLEECTPLGSYVLRVGGSGISPEVRRYVETMHNVETCLLDSNDDPAMTEDRILRLLAHQPEISTRWVAFVYGGAYFSGNWLEDAGRALGRSKRVLGIVGRVETRDCTKACQRTLRSLPWYAEAESGARSVKTCRPGFVLLPLDLKLLLDWPAKKDEVVISQEISLGLSARHTDNPVTEIGSSIVVGQIPVQVDQLDPANSD